MMSPRRFARARRVSDDKRLNDTEAFVENVDKKVQAQEPHVNALFNWSIWRSRENGFGQDFEFVLAHPRGK